MIARLTALALGLAMLTGCMNTRYIAASTGSGDQIKFLYVDQGGNQGVIKCNKAADGALSECRQMRLTLEGE